MIRPGDPCCDAAKEMLSKWYDESDLPSLPLPKCNMMTRCQCIYRHMDDRRKRERRVAEDRRGDIRFEPGHDDRRSGDDRRAGYGTWKQTI